MSIDFKKYLPVLTKIIIFIAIVLAVYYIGLPLVIILSPFILAMLFSIIIEPQVAFLEKRLKFNRKLASLVALLFSLIVFGTLLTLAIYKIVAELYFLSNNIPQYFKNVDLNNEFRYLSSLAQNYYLKISPEVTNLLETKLSETITSFSLYAEEIVSSVLSFILNFFKILPQTLLFIIITIISTYFISSDKRKIKKFIFRQFSKSTGQKVQDLKNDLLFAFFGFIKAQIIIMMISITLAAVGFSILGIKYAFVMGILVGLSELIPVIGTSLIFIPLIIYHFVSQNTYLALGLAGLFLLGVITRQVVEPKIVGDQIGLHPLITLIAIYVGLELFGIFGMILGPIIIILLRSLNKANVINLWKE